MRVGRYFESNRELAEIKKKTRFGHDTHWYLHNYVHMGEGAWLLYIILYHYIYLLLLLLLLLLLI